MISCVCFNWAELHPSPTSQVSLSEGRPVTMMSCGLPLSVGTHFWRLRTQLWVWGHQLGGCNLRNFRFPVLGSTALGNTQALWSIVKASCRMWGPYTFAPSCHRWCDEVRCIKAQVLCVRRGLFASQNASFTFLLNLQAHVSPNVTNLVDQINFLTCRYTTQFQRPWHNTGH